MPADAAPAEPLGAFALDLLDETARAALERELRSNAALRAELAPLPTAAAAVTLAALVLETDAVEARLEQRLIQRARLERPPRVRTPRFLQAVRRRLLWLLLLAAVACAALFGALAFQAGDPISGRALPLTADGATGVLLPQYQDRLFALIFWGLPQLAEEETWQLWLVRASGTVEPGPQFAPDAEGRAAVSVNPNLLETDDPLIGFTVSRDIPSNRTNETASADNILYQFPRE